MWYIVSDPILFFLRFFDKYQPSGRNKIASHFLPPPTNAGYAALLLLRTSLLCTEYFHHSIVGCGDCRNTVDLLRMGGESGPLRPRKNESRRRQMGKEKENKTPNPKKKNKSVGLSIQNTLSLGAPFSQRRIPARLDMDFVQRLFFCFFFFILIIHNDCLEHPSNIRLQPTRDQKSSF